MQVLPLVGDTIHYVNEAYESGKRVLVEGANATMLDLDFGTYPFVTSSNPSIGGVAAGLGLAPSKFEAIIGVVSLTGGFWAGEALICIAQFLLLQCVLFRVGSVCLVFMFWGLTVPAGPAGLLSVCGRSCSLHIPEATARWGLVSAPVAQEPGEAPSGGWLCRQRPTPPGWVRAPTPLRSLGRPLTSCVRWGESMGPPQAARGEWAGWTSPHSNMSPGMLPSSCILWWAGFGRPLPQHLQSLSAEAKVWS